MSNEELKFRLSWICDESKSEMSLTFTASSGDNTKKNKQVTCSHSTGVRINDHFVRERNAADAQEVIVGFLALIKQP